jgi:hypothetical protein
MEVFHESKKAHVLTLRNMGFKKYRGESIIKTTCTDLVTHSYKAKYSGLLKQSLVHVKAHSKTLPDMLLNQK